ncbi:MAG: hypothetical protein OEW97_01120 [Gammaproteobacteria bacterium]|nr:hypothetical protein [Gammaproteobacteria bacterium]
MSTTHPRLKSQSGVSVVTAIFLIVVLALMGTGMVSLLSTSQQSISQEFTAAKAYMAGRSCLQWGMYQAVFSGTTGSATTNFTNNTTGLFNTQCSTSIDSITADGLTFFNINTTALYAAPENPEYSRREMRLQFQP